MRFALGWIGLDLRNSIVPVSSASPEANIANPYRRLSASQMVTWKGLSKTLVLQQYPQAQGAPASSDNQGKC